MSIVYVDRETGFLHEVRIREDHVLIKPLGKNIPMPVSKLSFQELNDGYREYYGDISDMPELEAEPENDDITVIQ